MERGPMIVHLVSHADHIRHVLPTRHDIYNKDTRSSAEIRSFTGEGLLSSNGDFWLRVAFVLPASIEYSHN